MPQYEGVRTIAPEDKEAFYSPTGINYGFNNAHPDSKFILMLNDDTIVTKDSLKNMVNAIGDQNMILGCLSNCDTDIFHSLIMGFKDQNGHYCQMTDRVYRLEHVEKYIPYLMNAESIYPQGLIIYDKICLYANLIPTKLIKLIGGFDEAFKTGFDDTDFCLRAREANYPSVILMNAIIWHFGGVSAATTISDEMRDFNADHFSKKWGSKITMMKNK